jgi:hypothetical protein
VRSGPSQMTGRGAPVTAFVERRRHACVGAGGVGERLGRAAGLEHVGPVGVHAPADHRAVIADVARPGRQAGAQVVGAAGGVPQGGGRDAVRAGPLADRDAGGVHRARRAGAEIDDPAGRGPAERAADAVRARDVPADDDAAVVHVQGLGRDTRQVHGPPTSGRSCRRRACRRHRSGHPGRRHHHRHAGHRQARTPKGPHRTSPLACPTAIPGTVPNCPEPRWRRDVRHRRSTTSASTTCARRRRTLRGRTISGPAGAGEPGGAR